MNNKDCFCPFDEDLAREIFKKKDKQIRQLQAKLEQIKEICKTAPAVDTELSLRILDIIENEGIQTSVIEILKKNEQTHADNQKSCENNCSTASKFENEIYPDIDNQMHEWEQEQEKYAEMYADNYSDWI